MKEERLPITETYSHQCIIIATVENGIKVKCVAAQSMKNCFKWQMLYAQETNNIIFGFTNQLSEHTFELWMSHIELPDELTICCTFCLFNSSYQQHQHHNLHSDALRWTLITTQHLIWIIFCLEKKVDFEIC